MSLNELDFFNNFHIFVNNRSMIGKESPILKEVKSIEQTQKCKFTCLLEPSFFKNNGEAKTFIYTCTMSRQD